MGMGMSMSVKKMKKSEDRTLEGGEMEASALSAIAANRPRLKSNTIINVKHYY